MKPNKGRLQKLNLNSQDQASGTHQTVTDRLMSSVNSETGKYYTSQTGNESSVMLPADSVKQVEESDLVTGKKTSSTIFYTGGKLVNIHHKNMGIITGIKFSNSTKSIRKDHSEITDVSAYISKITKQDSLRKEKKVQAEGSGKSWPLITGLITALGLILYFICKKGLKLLNLHH